MHLMIRVPGSGLVMDDAAVGSVLITDCGAMLARGARSRITLPAAPPIRPTASPPPGRAGPRRCFTSSLGFPGYGG